MDKENIVTEHVIDCDAKPLVPEGWTVEEHRRYRKLAWDATKVQLYLSWRQKGEGYLGFIKGRTLQKELKDRPVLNANVLDWLLGHTHLIPEEWKDKWVYFWGTIYRDRFGDLRVRYLRWYDGRWWGHHDWIAFDWDDECPAAVRAS